MKTTAIKLLVAAFAATAAVAAGAAPVNYLVLRSDPFGFSHAATQIKASLRTTCPANYLVHRYGVNDAGGAVFSRTWGANFEQFYLGAANQFGVCVMGVPAQIVINAPAQYANNKLPPTANTTLSVGGPEIGLEAWTPAHESCRSATLVLPDGFMYFSGSWAQGTDSGFAYGHGIMGQPFGKSSYGTYGVNSSWVGSGTLVLQGANMQFVAYQSFGHSAQQNVGYDLNLLGCQVGGFTYTVGY